MPIRSALSDGLYQNEKYMTAHRQHYLNGVLQDSCSLQAGTTPDSGIPRKNRVASRPAAFWAAPMHIAIPPNPTMMSGKKNFPLYFFMSKFDGMRKAVTMKYVMLIAQLNWIPSRPRSVRMFWGVSAWRTPAYPIFARSRYARK